MWNDIDLYHAVRDFTTDPVSYRGEDVRVFTHELVCHAYQSVWRILILLHRQRTTSTVRISLPDYPARLTTP